MLQFGLFQLNPSIFSTTSRLYILEKSHVLDIHTIDSSFIFYL